MDITKFHTQMSLIKSAFRIIGCVVAGLMGIWQILAIGLVIAEFLGIAEEWDDE